jgi:Phosphatidylethanolamine-binding protein
MAALALESSARAGDPEPVHLRRRRSVAAASLDKRSRRSAIAGAAGRRPRCAAGRVHPLGRVGTRWGTGDLGEGEAAPGAGRNDFGTVGYRGPCPPRGHGPHRYVFHLCALARDLELDPGAGKPELEQAIEGHVLTAAELGTYER